MTSVPARQTHRTEQAYLRLEAQSALKHEFRDGHQRALPAVSPLHNQRAAALLGALVALVRKGPCRAFHSDQRIHVPATGLYTYADGGVAYGPWRVHADGMALLNPVLLYEVTSPSTADDDRGAKLEHYRQIAALRHVLVVDEPSRSIEHHRRGDDGVWRSELVVRGSVSLPDLGGEIDLDEVFLPDP